MATPLAADTAADIERRQVLAWRAMSPAEKAALVASLTALSQELALAGVRARFPHGSPAEHFLRLAILNHGIDLARRAWPEIADLDRP